MSSANDIRRYILDNSPWVNPDYTVDNVKWGDGDRDCAKAAVCWFPSIENLETAQEAGCQLLIAHQPLFYDHFDKDDHCRERGASPRKVEFLRKTELVVLRLHDSWDQWPIVGIRDSWAAFLGLERRVYASEDMENHRYYGVYEIPEQTLREFAQYVANRVRRLGEDSVSVIGSPDLRVRYPALGVGSIGPSHALIERGADVMLHCFDGASYWQVRENQHEQGVAVITLDHGTTELPGMENLRSHLSHVFPEIEFLYFDRHVRAWTVSGE